MSVKPAPPKPADAGTELSGKGLDTLDRFIIQSWGPRGRCGLWTGRSGLLSEPKAPAEAFLKAHLEALWHRDELSAILTFEPPYDPFVTLRISNDHKHLSPDSKYKPSHWAWRVVPPAEAVAVLEATLAAALPEAERAYLLGLKQGLLQEAWAAST